MVSGIHHAGFTVSDLERSVTFYEAGLGLQVVSRIEGPKEYHSELLGYENCHIRVAFMGNTNGPTIELIEYVYPEAVERSMETYAVGNGHVCFIVDDVAETFDALIAQGATPRSPRPVAITSGPNKGVQAAFLRDPDGISIELYQPPTPN